jgi:hypothetical protein
LTIWLLQAVGAVAVDTKQVVVVLAAIALLRELLAVVPRQKAHLC